MKNKQKLIITLIVIVVAVGAVLLFMLGKHDGANQGSNARQAQSTNVSSNSSSHQQPAERSSSSSTTDTSSSETHVINTAEDAAALVAHAMAADDSLYHGVPTNGGFLVTRDDPTQKALVHFNGDITWYNDDGSSETQPYSEVSGAEDNGRVNGGQFVPAN